MTQFLFLLLDNNIDISKLHPHVLNVLRDNVHLLLAKQEIMEKPLDNELTSSSSSDDEYDEPIFQATDSNMQFFSTW